MCNEFLAFENHTAEQREESKNFAQIRFRTPFIVENYEAEGENVEVVGARAEEARIIVEKNRWHDEKKKFAVQPIFIFCSLNSTGSLCVHCHWAPATLRQRSKLH